MDADLLKGIGAVCTVLGSLLLAWRVTGILKALSGVAKIHDDNIMELSKQTGSLVIGTGSIEWIEKARQTKLLILGFILSIAGGVFQLLASVY